MLVAIGGFESAGRLPVSTVDFTFPFSVEITRVDYTVAGLLTVRVGAGFFKA